jgi:hypothetical protein
LLREPIDRAWSDLLYGGTWNCASLLHHNSNTDNDNDSDDQKMNQLETANEECANNNNNSNSINNANNNIKKPIEDIKNTIENGKQAIVSIKANLALFNNDSAPAIFEYDCFKIRLFSYICLGAYGICQVLKLTRNNWANTNGLRCLNSRNTLIAIPDITTGDIQVICFIYF